MSILYSLSSPLCKAKLLASDKLSPYSMSKLLFCIFENILVPTQSVGTRGNVVTCHLSPVTCI